MHGLRYSLISLLMYFSVSKIKSLTTKIEDATSRGILVRFFNSTDDASSLKSHHDKLDRIMNEATVSQLVVDCTVATDTNHFTLIKLVGVMGTCQDVHGVQDDIKVFTTG